MKCPLNYVISVTSANFGRTADNGGFCSNDLDHHDHNDNCHSPNSFSIVQQKCDTKNLCRVGANTAIFGDPCYGTLKYLEVRYACEPEEGNHTYL